MMLHKQLRWSGLLIIVVALLLNSVRILMDFVGNNVIIQAVYGIGFIGLILACTIIYFVQARKTGVLGTLAYLVTVLCLAFANIATFLTLTELSGVREARDALLVSWESIPVTPIGTYGTYLGFIIFGISITQAGVLPKWSGILIVLGVALQVSAQLVMTLFSPLLFIFEIGGSFFFSAGLVLIGWTLWSGRNLNVEDLGLSKVGQSFGGPVVIMTGLFLGLDAAVNMLGGLSLTGAITHLISFTTVLLTAGILFAAQGSQLRWIGFSGFLLGQIGPVLYLTTAFLILAQLTGGIDNNRVLMYTWENIPVGRYGGYLTTLGLFLLGVEAIRSRVFPRWSGWLVVIGIALALPFTFTIQAYYLGIFWVLGAALQGTGFAWMGWSLLTTKDALGKISLSPLESEPV